MSSITFRVLDQNGKNYVITTNAAQSVSDMKSTLAASTKQPADKIKLIHKHHLLDDSTSVESLGLDNESTLHVYMPEDIASLLPQMNDVFVQNERTEEMKAETLELRIKSAKIEASLSQTELANLQMIARKYQLEWSMLLQLYNISENNFDNLMANLAGL